MSRLHGRVDQNQEAIVRALRGAGASVQSLASVGCGCPDLLVGFRGGTILMEIKNPKARPCDRALTIDEVDWIKSWRGSKVFIVETVDEALAWIGATSPTKLRRASP